MRKIVLYIAMSLDGYIADESGNVDWLGGHNNENNEPGSYPEFIKTVDTVILGWTTYHQIAIELFPQGWPYEGMKSYVITHRQAESTDEIIFTDKNPVDLINELKVQKGKDIWICGGASVINPLIKSDLIDQYTISIIPTVMGRGIRLFENDLPERKLKLISTTHYDGITDLVYEPRDPAS